MFRRISRTRQALAAAAAVAALALAACGGGGGGTSGTGTLSMSLTDAPACGFDQVNVTITDISVNQSASAGDNDGGWVHIPITAQKIDLLDLQNGALSTLGQTPLPPGKYTQMRLLLASNTGATMANSVVPTPPAGVVGTEYPLDTPSAQRTGLKMNVDIDIAADQMADFVIDFNACKSVVTAGASGKYLLKPVLRVTPQFISGVKGTVDASIEGGTGANTMVMLEVPGTSTTAPVVVKATAPDSNGNYLLEPVGAGTYDLVVTSNGHATAVVTGVVVQDKLVTTIATQINPPASSTGTVSGSVTPVPTDATLIAQQTLTGGDRLEIAYVAADSVLGTYSFSLPVAAPIVAPYTTGSLTFTADGGAAGKYTVAATSGTTTKTSGLLTVTTSSNPPVNFTFP
ncbi:MAG: DUF4382 domain-containing protein [Betaproteobacteria bacterium]